MASMSVQLNADASSATPAASRLLQAATHSSSSFQTATGAISPPVPQSVFTSYHYNAPPPPPAPIYASDIYVAQAAGEFMAAAPPDMILEHAPPEPTSQPPPLPVKVGSPTEDANRPSSRLSGRGVWNPVQMGLVPFGAEGENHQNEHLEPGPPPMSAGVAIAGPIMPPNYNDSLLQPAPPGNPQQQRPPGPSVASKNKKQSKEEKKREKEMKKREKEAQKAAKKAGLTRSASAQELNAAERAEVGVGSGGSRGDAEGRPLARSASTMTLGQRFVNRMRSSLRRIKRIFSKGHELELSPPVLLSRDQPRPTLSAQDQKQATRRVVVVLLDGDEVQFEIEKKCTGGVLFNRVCAYLNLVEQDFFGLTFVHSLLNVWFWLDFDKPILKQLKHGEEWLFRFQVKFYPPDPMLVFREEISRYQLTLQLRQDIYYGKLPVDMDTLALMGAYMVQSEVGDYEGPDADDDDDEQNSQDENEAVEHEAGARSHHQPPDIEYLRKFPFCKNHETDELLQKIARHHRKLRGTTPGDADIEYIKLARKLEFYGIDLHPVRDAERTKDLELGVFFAGIIVFRERRRLEFYTWPNVLKISYKKLDFCLKLRNIRNPNSSIDTSYALPNSPLTKRLWKIAIENHSFFQLKATKPESVRNSRMSSAGAASTPEAKKKDDKKGFKPGTLWAAQQTSVARPEQPAFQRLASKRISQSMGALDRAGAQSAPPGDHPDAAAHVQLEETQQPAPLKLEDMILPPPRFGTLRPTRSLDALNMQRSASVRAPDKHKSGGGGGLFKKWGSQRSSSQGTPLGQQSKEDKAEKKRREKEEKERKKKGGKGAEAPARLSFQAPGAAGTLGPIGAAPLIGDEPDEAERAAGHQGAEPHTPDVQVQMQVRSVPVPAVSYPQGPRITIRPRADPTESGRGSRASGEVRIERAPAYSAEAPPPPPPPPLPSRFTTTQDGAYNTITELPPAAGVALEPRFRALSPSAVEQQRPVDPPPEQMPAGGEEEEEEEEQEQEGGTDESSGEAEGDAQIQGSFPPPPPRPPVHVYTHVVRLKPAEPYGNLDEYSAEHSPESQQQQQETGDGEEQLEDVDGDEGASGDYDDGVMDGEEGGAGGQQLQHPPPPPPPNSHYQQQSYHYQYPPQRVHEEDAV